MIVNIPLVERVLGAFYDSEGREQTQNSNPKPHLYLTRSSSNMDPREHVNEQNRSAKVATSAFFPTCKGPCLTRTVTVRQADLRLLFSWWGGDVGVAFSARAT